MKKNRIKQNKLITALAVSGILAGLLTAGACGSRQDSDSQNSSPVAVSGASSEDTSQSPSSDSASGSSAVSADSASGSSPALSASSADGTSSGSSDQNSAAGSSDQTQDFEYTGQQMEGETKASSTDAEASKPVTSGDNSIIFPDSSSENISKEDVDKLSAAQKQSAINEIYARHGYDFPDESTKSYYEDFDWYSPSETDKSKVESSFNEYERANLELLEQ